ncbi:hypothetical protein [Burkholderia gladioli]|uniref:hypothetical protein n=1 Tax=Burkholderia gladioli TaxID=28095 RepID=UPI00163FD68C|nr:hypothetical protein [Burkholderia gladioli]
MSTPTTLEAVRNPAPREASLPAVRAGFFDLQGFELLQRVAKAFSSSTLVPAQYQNNVANCMIALNLARRLGADELMVMQNLYIVHGNPGWSSKFLIASVNTCGRFETLRYEWRGTEGADNFGCRAWTIEKSTGERLNGTWIDWKMVKAEGWNKKSGSKWLTMPDQMFVYRSAAFWQRAYAPEISMGLSSQEELIDTVEVRADGSVSVTTSIEELRGTRAQPADEVRRMAAAAHTHEQRAEDPPTASDQAEDPPGDSAHATGADGDDQQGGFGFDFDVEGLVRGIREDIDTAKTAEDLDLARGAISGVPNETVKAELNARAAARMRAITAAAEQAAASTQKPSAASARRQRGPISAD